MRKGWNYQKLGSLCKTGAGGTPLKSKKENYENGTIAWLRSGEVNNRDIIDCKIRITETGLNNSSAKLFPPRTVLIAMYGATAGQVGILNFECSTNQAVCGIMPNEKFVPEFLYYFFLKFKEELIAQAVGGAQPNISQQKIKNTLIPNISLEEQKQIVAILDKAFASIDQVKSNIEKNIVNAKELFQSKLNDIFSQRGDGWEEKTILELCNHKSQIVGGPFGSNLKVKDYQETGIPILRLQNIGKGYFIDKNIKYVNEEKAKELDYHSFVSGDIALAKLGIPIGKTCIIPEKFKYGIVTADVVRIRPNKEEINYSFLKHFLNSQSAVQQLTDDITGATRPRVNMAEVRNLKLSVPSKEQQISLNNIIDSLEADINNVISNYEKKNVDLEDLKKSILQKAFAGELT
jgi:type I restriction enzyme S subunit